jgi:hypothetical protein
MIKHKENSVSVNIRNGKINIKASLSISQKRLGILIAWLVSTILILILQSSLDAELLKLILKVLLGTFQFVVIGALNRHT